jgi:trans-2,3-dihydro-3-hydroxyanthranilate isomerase
MSLTFYIVDVFAERKYAGNQLAVFRDAGRLSARDMQQIARETNFSETTFILSDAPRKGGYDVRIFTPAEEVPFAGHPTLGTACIIRDEIMEMPVQQVVLNLKIGPVPVAFHRNENGAENLWMRQIPPTFSRRLEASPVADALGLDVGELDERFPIEEVSTGLPFVLAPLKTLASLRRIRVNLPAYHALIEPLTAKAIFVFCPETYEAQNDLSARMFAERLGAPEDPATGSAGGCLAAYLVAHRYFGRREIDICVEQGVEMGRPSLLLLRAQDDPAGVEIHVGGKVVRVAHGEWNEPAG